MYLSDLILEDIPAKSRQKGEHILRRGKVREARLVQPNHVRAVVLGTRPYEVEVLIDPDGEPWSRCACPAFDRIGPCKHIWALARAADELGFDLERGPIPSDVESHLLPYDDDDDEFLDDDDLGDMFGSAPEAPLPGDRRLHALAGLLADGFDPFAGHAPGDTRLIYTLDAETSRAEDCLHFDVWMQARRKNGSWGAARSRDPKDERVWDVAGAQDREVLAPLGRLASRWMQPWRYREDPVEARDPALAAGRLLPALLETGRLYLSRGPAGGPQKEPLEFDDGPPWVLGFSVEETGTDGETALRGFLARGSERMDLSVPDMVFSGFVLLGNRLARLDDGGALTLAAMVRHSGPLTIPREMRDFMREFITRIPGAPRLEIGPFGPIRSLPLVPHLAVAAPDSPRALKTRLPCRIAFGYGPLRIDAVHPGRLLADPEGEGLLQRDPDAERAAIDAFLEAGGLPPPASGELGEARVPTPTFPDLVATLLGAGWTIEADGVPYRRSGTFQLSVTSGIDWFDLAGGLDFGGVSASLPALIEAARQGSRTVQLGDGSVGVLPETWLEGWDLAQAVGRPEGDGLRFHASQGWALDALLAAQPDVDVDRRFREYRERLQAFSGIQPARTPKSLRATLRAYQQEGLAWLRFLETMGLGGCLADDMGLGKTIQVLALLAGRKASRTKHPPSLVVVPRSLVFHWKDEAARFAPRLRVLDLTGPQRHDRFEDLDRHDLVITTYGTLRRDIVKLRDTRFDYAILDESQAIKNPASQSAKAARLLQADHRLALSGTPVENHLGELWSLFEFLNPGMLGKARVFKEIVGGSNGRALDDAGRARLAQAIRPFVLRRTKEEVLDDLPAKTEQILHCEMSAKQRRDYDSIRNHVRATLLEKAKDAPANRMKIHVLEALLRLRQVACHVGLLDAERRGEPSAKLDTLLSSLEEILQSDHKVLVFSQFTTLLAIVRDRLDQQGVCYEYLDGRTRKRHEKVERFQGDPDCRVFLISLKAGGLGLNLTAADYVFLLDPWWNPAVERQAVDRAHRIGQKRSVMAYRLICTGTVEEKVLQLQDEKRALAEAVIGGDRSLLKDLTREDLEALLA